MVREIVITQKHSICSYNSSACQICLPEKVIDFSDECVIENDTKTHLFIFTHENRGKFVHIAWSNNERGVYKFSSFLINQIKEWLPAPCGNLFDSVASELGLSKQKLCNLITTHCPKYQ